MPDIPKIKKVSEIGETPFRVVNVEEKILQGWDQSTKRMLYLFKDSLGLWSYYSKEQRCAIQVTEWREKEALIMGKWIKMSLYYRLHIAFANPITYSVFNRGRNQQFTTTEAIILVTKSVYEMLEQQFAGRPAGSYYKFGYKTLKKGDTIDAVYFVQ